MKEIDCVNGSNTIDIVLPWVDGSDKVWQECKALYKGESSSDNSEERYRDWGLLKYLFRGIEQNLPWVRTVHFITCGHLPVWLNTDCDKLNVVNHSDYIPEEYLPTFSANPIELNIHRIKELSEQFIYINDDFFFMNEMNAADFFKNGLPCSQAGLNIRNESDAIFNGILYKDRRAIDRQFYSRDVIKKNVFKFLNHKYGLKSNFKTLFLLPFCTGYFPSFEYVHGPNAYLKSTFETVWEKEYDVLNETCTHKFRQFDDVNQYLMLWWQWCEGNFYPENIQDKLKYIGVNESVEYLSNTIRDTKKPMLCINDAKTNEFDIKRSTMIQAFESKFPEKSSFELLTGYDGV